MSNNIFDVKYKIIRNPDPEFQKSFKKKLNKNGGYCPCKFEKIEDNKCPCKEFRETKECECTLYIKVPDYD